MQNSDHLTEPDLTAESLAELPPLPEAGDDPMLREHPYYTASSMRAYALAAIRGQRLAGAKDAARWRWLVAQHDPEDLPIAQVVWKCGSNPHGEWVNLIDGADLTRHVDAAL